MSKMYESFVGKKWPGKHWHVSITVWPFHWFSIGWVKWDNGLNLILGPVEFSIVYM